MQEQSTRNKKEGNYIMKMIIESEEDIFSMAKLV